VLTYGLPLRGCAKGGYFFKLPIFGIERAKGVEPSSRAWEALKYLLWPAFAFICPDNLHDFHAVASFCLQIVYSEEGPSRFASYDA
jgi:hypothetical protein